MSQSTPIYENMTPLHNALFHYAMGLCSQTKFCFASSGQGVVIINGAFPDGKIARITCALSMLPDGFTGDKFTFLRRDVYAAVCWLDRATIEDMESFKDAYRENVRRDSRYDIFHFQLDVLALGKQALEQSRREGSAMEGRSPSAGEGVTGNGVTRHG